MRQKKARVVNSYSPRKSDELELNIDDIIDVLDTTEEGWYKGRLRGRVGIFPSRYVETLTEEEMNETDNSDIEDENIRQDDKKKGKQENIDNVLNENDLIKPKQFIGVPTPLRLGTNIKTNLKPVECKAKPTPKKPPPQTSSSDNEPAPSLPPKPMREQAKVLYPYDAQNSDELTIKEGDIIYIISKEIEDQGWWKGELNGKIGVFPDNFVTLIKLPSSEEVNLPPRGKKPEKSLEKSALLSSSNLSSILSSPKLREVNRNNSNTIISNNKMSDEKSSPSSTSQAPLVPSKKPKPFGTSGVLGVKSSSSNLSTSSLSSSLSSLSSSSKPDVVPQEGVILREKDSKEDMKENKSNETGNNENNGDINLGCIETSNKLTHLTINRARGPKERRPPSLIGLPKECESDNYKENGDVKIQLNQTLNKVIQSENNSNNTGTGVSSNNIGNNTSKPTSLPAWMVELKKNQAERRKIDANTEETAKEGSSNKTSPISSTKSSTSSPSSASSSSSRFSGDFTSKFGANKEQPASLPVDIADNSNFRNSSLFPVSKPAKALKPLSTTPPHVSPLITNSSPKSTIGNSLKQASQGSAASVGASIESISSSLDKATDLSDLQKEIKLIKETMLDRKEHKDLVKQVNELKELVEAQKQSYGTIIKDLINEVAEERKKLATLVIEVDRLRKLSTTV